MKFLLTSLTVVWLHCNVVAQQQISFPYQTHMPLDSAKSEAVHLAQKPESEKKFFKANAQELRLVGRSIVVLTATSGAGVAGFKFGDEPLQEFSATHHIEFTNHLFHIVEPFGRSRNMLPVSGLVYATGLTLRNPKLQRTGLLLCTSIVLNDFVTGKIKNEFQRRRPNEAIHNYYFEGGEGGRHHVSFPSAHTSTAFTFATSVATEYSDYKWVPPVAYSMATLVGISRIYDNQHWATDVMAGAAVGFLTAKTTNLILKQAEKQLQKHKINIYVAPKVSANNLGVNLGGTF